MNRYTIRLGYYAGWGIIVLTVIYVIGVFLPLILYDPTPIWRDAIRTYDYIIPQRNYATDFCDFVGFIKTPLILILFVCFHDYSSISLKIFSRISLSFVVSYAALRTINYFVQLTISRLDHLVSRKECMKLFTYSFLEDFMSLVSVLSWSILMGLAMLFLIPVFTKTTKIDKTIKLTLLINGIAGFVYALFFILNLEKILEFCAVLIFISFIIFLVLSVILFRRLITQENNNKTIPNPPDRYPHNSNPVM